MMPTPIAGESEQEWMGRCVPKLISEGNPEDQAVAICLDMWRNKEAQPMQEKQFTGGLEVKSLDEGGFFEGYASMFGVQDSDGDVIVKGAFKESLEKAAHTGRMPKMLWQHDHRQIIGKWMEMREDDNGLWVKGQLILEVEQAREAYALMKAGVLDAMSVGFNIPEGGTQGMHGRVIEKADLWETSLVTWGANPEARITNCKSIKDFERFLRDAGYSRKEATAITSRGYKAAFDQGDPEPDQEALDALQTLKAKIEELSHG